MIRDAVDAIFNLVTKMGYINQSIVQIKVKSDKCILCLEKTCRKSYAIPGGTSFYQVMGSQGVRYLFGFGRRFPVYLRVRYLVLDRYNF